jgi:hypothetical protein
MNLGAAGLLAESTSRVTYELARFQGYTERWHYLVLGAALALLAAFVVITYRRDSVELRPGVGVLLAILRLVALGGVFAYYCNLEKRTEQQVTHNSRAIVLVDTSLSMGLHDTDSSAVPASPTRLEQVATGLGDRKLIDQLRAVHDVSLLRFDSEVARVATLNKITPPVEKQGQASDATSAPKQPTAANIDVQKLTPQGTESRLGQALRSVLDEERIGPVSGVLLFSDGAQNAGPDATSAIALAIEAKIPVYTIGIGSDRRPANVRVSDLVAPSRAYPGDAFTITGYVQAQEMDGRAVTVELTSRPPNAPKSDEGKLEGSERVTLASRGEITPVKFEITPSDKGRLSYRLRIKAPPEDVNAADNQQDVDVEIVDRQTRLLLIASGPTREYTFARNLLRRDKEMIVDVWLQSAKEGISQDAHSILYDFPSTPQELFAYDGILAFDPDWTRLTPEEIELLERWVAEKAGGMIVIAGPVEADRWTSDAKFGKLRSLYPVEFNRRLSVLEDGRYGSETPWPLEFTREGMEAEFLWLSDSGARSQSIWSTFPGVFGYYTVRGAKPGATVYARYSDPESAIGGELPVYMAGQFYGAGRVFYLGSGEMWRLRAMEEGYFEQIYTKLVRYVTQGRLLGGSSHGMLLVERDRYYLGSSVAVRAALSNARFEPLAVPRVTVEITRPDSTTQSLSLTADTTRQGMYQGQFTALQEGAYRLDLAPPDGADEQISKRIQVRVPDLERENPERNDALLADIARRTGGRYYVGVDAALGARGLPAVASELKDRTETSYLTGVKDQQFDRWWMQIILGVVCGSLSLEWLIRRLSRLA